MKTRTIKRSKPKDEKPKKSVKFPGSEPLEGVQSLTIVHREQNKQRMLHALEKHLSVVYYACKEAGISRRAHYLWMNNDPDYRASVEEINENCGDFVERKLLEAVQDKQPAVMIFLAKTKWKNRGYIERNEITGADGGDIRINGHMSISQTQQEVPPSVIEDIVKKMMGGNGQAAAALEKLHSKGRND